VKEDQETYSSILGTLSVASLECDAVTLVLETLWGDETLDLWCLGVWLLALTLWLDLTTNDKLADLNFDSTSLAYQFLFSHSAQSGDTDSNIRNIYCIWLRDWQAKRM
jgi:hypothetical protein